mmetsp:Transcript_27173/g.84541  ORF Transcript_27173/g.84541 Transcript_27173/m.84541 type:complete len:301 (-) Transcript_27173:477-1379(-)
MVVPIAVMVRIHGGWHMPGRGPPLVEGVRAAAEGVHRRVRHKGGQPHVDPVVEGHGLQPVVGEVHSRPECRPIHEGVAAQVEQLRGVNKFKHLIIALRKSVQQHAQVPKSDRALVQQHLNAGGPRVHSGQGVEGDGPHRGHLDRDVVEDLHGDVRGDRRQGAPLVLRQHVAEAVVELELVLRILEHEGHVHAEVADHGLPRPVEREARDRGLAAQGDVRPGEGGTLAGKRLPEGLLELPRRPQGVAVGAVLPKVIFLFVMERVVDLPHIAVRVVRHHRPVPGMVAAILLRPPPSNPQVEF